MPQTASTAVTDEPKKEAVVGEAKDIMYTHATQWDKEQTKHIKQLLVDLNQYESD